MHDVVPLQILTNGQKARVAQLVGCPEQVHRLEELGLRGGADIEMVKGGSTCIIRLSGNKLCLRETESMGILVQPGDAE